MNLIRSGMIAILATFFFVWLFRRLAIWLEFVDRPGGRKRHKHNIPLVGGIAIFFAFTFALLSLPFALHHYQALLAGCGLLLIIGIIDDFRELNSKLRLLGEVTAVILMIFWGNVQISDLGNLLLFGNIHLGFWGIPFTVFLVVGFLNAINMIDGQDGLAGGVTLGEGILLCYLAWHGQHWEDMAVLTMLGLSLIVFLTFNIRMPWRKHAAIFLGDSGSTLVAFAIAWFAISLGQTQDEVIKPVIILWILAFPVFDLLHVCMVRFAQRKPLLMPSLDHFHYLIQAAGLDPVTSTGILTMFSFALGIMGILLNHFQVPEVWQLLSWFGILLAYLLVAKRVRKSIVEYGYADSHQFKL